MKAISYLKENYIKVIAITILAILTSAVTCCFLWPDPPEVMADNTDNYGMVQELVKEEVDSYISEKKEILTQEDVGELKKRIDEVLEKNGLIMKTIYQSKELEKIIKECVEKTVAGDRDAASDTAGRVVELLKRIEENDKAYRELVNSYDAYKAEMTEKLARLKEETENILSKKTNNADTERELEALRKEIDKVSGLTDDFEKDTDKRISGLDKDILSNRSAFDSFVNIYNEYKTSVKEILDSKAAKSDIDALAAQADKLEKSLQKSIEENEKAILANEKAIAENEKAIKQNTDILTSITSSLSGKKIWVGSREEYDAISKKNSDTLYFIR